MLRRSWWPEAPKRIHTLQTGLRNWLLEEAGEGGWEGSQEIQDWTEPAGKQAVQGWVEPERTGKTGELCHQIPP